ncbi:DUF1610 domain-containing protein [Desulfurococcaceae archaeon MEX13E-LK6-19]|nr:DUF1610 domain-containing protein [Desulfurococcaceae archaeon MEX13E-LK6-19]
MASKYEESGGAQILEAASPPICSSCHRPLQPHEHGVSFSCPNCGTVLIWRCKKCRKFSVQYKCPNCGFVGP